MSDEFKGGIRQPLRTFPYPPKQAKTLTTNTSGPELPPAPVEVITTHTTGGGDENARLIRELGPDAHSALGQRPDKG